MSRSTNIDELLMVLARYGRVRERLATTTFITPEGIVETAAFHCLVVLADRPMRSGELAETLYADPSTVSRHVASLVGLGYVRRESDPRDGRATILVLTASGRERVAVVRNHRMNAVQTMLHDFSDAELADLNRLMGRMVDAAEDMVATVSARAASSGIPATPSVDTRNHPAAQHNRTSTKKAQATR